MSTSISMKIMEQDQAAIIALNLDGLPDANVLIHKRPSTNKKDLPANTPMPCVIIAPVPEEIDPNAGPTGRDDIGYKYRILMLSKGNQSQSLNFDRTLLWRESIRRRLMNMRFTAIPETMRSTIAAGPVFDAEAWGDDMDLSGLTQTVLSRETRLP